MGLKRLWRWASQRLPVIFGHSNRAGGEPFDADWYLEAYPDVAQAGIDPWSHYVNHGRHEGRLPARNRAIAWEYHLMRGGESLMLPRLEALTRSREASDQERYYAAWSLARWCAARDDWRGAVNYLLVFLDSTAPYPVHAGPYYLMLYAALQCGRVEIARRAFGALEARFPGHPALFLARANMFSASADSGERQAADQQKLAAINQLFESRNLVSIGCTLAEPLVLDNLRAGSDLTAAGSVDAPRVSVVVPVFNAERTIETALRALCQQTWRNLEILVVNDASTDGSQQVLDAFVSETGVRAGLNIRLLSHSVNHGAYAARNTALVAATGDFITTHDSDDWSHPQKIELQVRALLEAPDKVASVSHWVRATESLEFGAWHIDDSWVYRNVSSLMVRRSVVDTLGYWDRVSVNADTEYYYRILSVFGEGAITEVCEGIPLAFGRIDSGSLSRRSDTHLVTRYGGLRKDYEDAARRWHARAIQASDLYLAENPDSRPFLAPAKMCREDKPVVDLDPRDQVQQSGLFNSAWYLRQYPDVCDCPVDLFEHFWETGLAEGRDPGPGFSVSGYLRKYPEVYSSGLNPLYHYLSVGKDLGYQAHPIFSGDCVKPFGGFRLLVCAHQAGTQLYGAERSLLDVLDALSQLGVEVVVTLPSAVNSEYLEAVRSSAHTVVVLPYGWWFGTRAPCTETKRHFADLLTQYNIQAVLANTSVLEEPLLAAREMGIPSLVHVREIPQADTSLCQILGADADAVAAKVRSLADIVMVNSDIVKRSISVPEAVLVPNIIRRGKITRIQAEAGPRRVEQPVRVAMLSSNLPKKGLNDFVALVELLATRIPEVRCFLVGPENMHIANLRERQRVSPLLKNLVFYGYAEDPEAVLAEVDIVVNLSQFQESFGRTALEAMAAARPVIGYQWGALPEVILDGETGYLVPFGDVNAVVDRIAELAASQKLREVLGRAGQRRVREHFSEEIMQRQLAAVLERAKSLAPSV
ncbi:glycosyltransferase [Microbulbifer celer]|uniref:Glycosyltransferase n=1 Tax=Microbulbifer celer TaxID=435905 RepID=A0ABW3U7K0_9GAMM|nr:glycosyltransferase [Microbulbifer celer]UFN57875.1 glycosyltransferase [Microbulbifer celer]